MLVLAIADRFLEVIGLATVIYWTVRITRRLTRRPVRHVTHKPISLNGGDPI